MRGYYFLSQVRDQWYLVEQAARSEWQDWIDEPGMSGLFIPPYAKKVAGPQDVVFKAPLERQYGDSRLHQGEWA
ncbi:hypothetical protein PAPPERLAPAPP_05320 [Brevundimonas phage vB_BpoS-Papperlapapp]|uniref:Uncharacterized protein n=2 Tax=Marchewkavirus TaxID=3425052 RepID=A0A9E7SLW1_9CAUD|nr:hypothetical protein KABACHOK_03690 [Brevundimonas phage vB_BpoS-Kabachok]USN14897.1 hypothetical protein DOMOVOI_04260 [Brevundimonas phage vB_BpoS-Domovoi]USN16270.1 hypothetical protein PAPPERLAPAPP_05320 [Brevundimonas phage vB_BpoS-Papperlapapp]